MDFRDAAKAFRKSIRDELQPKFKRLKQLDLFVLDNSIRESTVGATRGHTLQNKHDILAQIKEVGIEDNIIASFSHMRRVDDKFIDEIRNKGEDMSSKYAFSEFFDEYDEKTQFPKPGIPIGMQKCRDLGIPNVILEVDLAHFPKDTKFNHKARCDLFKERFDWIKKNISPESRILINLRDLPVAFEKKTALAFKTIQFLSQYRPQIFAILTEEPSGKYFPEQLGKMTKGCVDMMRSHGFNGHFLVHIHQQWGLHDAGQMECLAMGATGIWCAIPEEGAALGHASSCMTIMNLIRLGNKKVLKRYKCTQLRKAAAEITRIVSGKPAHPKQPVYGARAVDQVFGLGGMGGDGSDFDLAEFFGIEKTKRITTLASNKMIVDRLTRLFGEDPQFTEKMAKKMKEQMLDDYKNNMKEEYHSPVGLASLFDKAGGEKTPAMIEALSSFNVQSLHIQGLIDEIHVIWREWDCFDGSRDDKLTFDNFYNAFMKPYFGCYRCEDTRKALSVIDVVDDDMVSWNEFLVFLKWAGHQYPKTDSADDLLEIAFVQGIIPSVTQDQVTKPKPPTEDISIDWEGYFEDNVDECWHTSVFDFSDDEDDFGFC